jgi:signal transduction histidine kinase
LFKGNANYFISFNDSTSGQLQIMADKDQFKRMLTNLIKNAIQAIPQERKGEIQLFMGEVSGKMKLKISDNGSGIPAELHEKIYIPNFSTKSEGMGLGLAMVKNILESMNGKIQFETKLNSGTTFEIEIPIKKEI